MTPTGPSAIVRLLTAWVRLVMARPRAALMLFVVLAAAGAWHGVTHLRIDTEARNMIDGSLRYRQTYQEFLRIFGEVNESVAIIVRAPTIEAADAATLELVETMKAREDRFASVFASAVDPHFRDNGLLFLSLEELRDLSGRLSEATPFLERLARDPSLKGLFRPLEGALEQGFEPDVLAALFDQLSESGEAALAGDTRPVSWALVFSPDAAPSGGPVQRVINAIPVQDFGSLNPAKDAVATIQEIIAVLQTDQAFAGVKVSITGDPILRSQELRSVSSGIGLSTALSILLVGIVLAIGLRAWQLVTASLLSLLIGLVLTMGFASVAVGEFNLVSIAFAVLFIGLGIDFAIHFALGYQEARAGGQGHEAAMQAAASEIGLALLLCAPTTALCFYAFVPTKFVGMAALGIISGTGVFIAFFTAITIIPAWISLFPKVKAPKPRLASAKAKDRFRRVSIPVAVVGLIAGVAALPLLGQVRFDANPMNLRDPNASSVQAFDLLFYNDNTVPYTLQFVSDDLAAADRQAAVFKQQPLIRQVVTLSSFVPKEQDEKLFETDFLSGQLAYVFGAEAEPTEAMAEKRSAIEAFLTTVAAKNDEFGDLAFRASAQRLSLVLTRLLETSDGALERFETAIYRHLPGHLDLLERQVAADVVTLADVPDHLRSLYIAKDGRARLQLYPAEDVRDDGARARFVQQALAVDPDVTGTARMVLNAGRYVSEAMVQATGSAAVLAFLLLWVSLRRLGTVLLILAPLVLAGVLTMAAGVALDMPFNFANVIVLPLLIGLGVDSGIHFVLRAQQGGDPFAVISTSTPKAVLLSALTTIGSFGTLGLNAHRGTASMGILLTIAISLTLICTLVVLPGLWALLAKRRSTSETRQA